MVRALRPSWWRRDFRNELHVGAAFHQALCLPQVGLVDHLPLPAEGASLRLRRSEHLRRRLQLFRRRGERGICDVDLRWVDRHLAIESRVRSPLGFCAEAGGVLEVGEDCVDCLHIRSLGREQGQALAKLKDVEPIPILVLPPLHTHLCAEVLGAPRDRLDPRRGGDLLRPQRRLWHFRHDGEQPCGAHLTSCGALEVREHLPDALDVRLARHLGHHVEVWAASPQGRGQVLLPERRVQGVDAHEDGLRSEVHIVQPAADLLASCGLVRRCDGILEVENERVSLRGQRLVEELLHAPGHEVQAPEPARC
mmetsp:Transcript_48087/g.138482  ORF Transcript_48087/g.138482 Transcript_48087/m.138482 type:complete len:309 (+) Transcript_48087:447-1373(+)